MIVPLSFDVPQLVTPVQTDSRSFNHPLPCIPSLNPAGDLALAGSVPSSQEPTFQLTKLLPALLIAGGYPIPSAWPLWLAWGCGPVR
jgi:hypothetical protein